MTSRDMHAEVMRTLEGMRTKLDGVESLARENKGHLQRICPQKTVVPVPRPKQGAQLARGASVTRYLRQYLNEKNSGISDGQQRYETFSEDVEDKQYNTDAMHTLEWILGLHLGSNLGVLTWEQVCKRSPGKMGLIIRDAIGAPELKVFSQAAGQWAIQMLITSKMNSRIRYNRDRRDQEAAEQQVDNFASMSVPDLEPEQALPEINSDFRDERFQDEYQETECFDEEEDDSLPRQRRYPGKPSSFVADRAPDEGLHRYSMRRTVQSRRAPQIDQRTSPSANAIVQSSGATMQRAGNRNDATTVVRGISATGRRARGRGARSSRAASNAESRVISRPSRARPSRARRGSVAATRRGSRR